MTTALQKSTAPRKYLSYQFYLRISWNLVWDAGPNPEIEIPFMISNPEDFQIRNHDHQVKPGDMITKAAWVWRGVTQILPSAPQRKNKYRLGGWNMSSLKKTIQDHVSFSEFDSATKYHWWFPRSFFNLGYFTATILLELFEQSLLIPGHLPSTVCNCSKPWPEGHGGETEKMGYTMAGQAFVNITTYIRKLTIDFWIKLNKHGQRFKNTDI